MDDREENIDRSTSRPSGRDAGECSEMPSGIDTSSDVDAPGDVPGVAMLEDANEALRFIESTMSMEESQTFIDGIDEEEPGLADRLRRMRDDHRLLRTASLEESAHGDLLGPVRGQLARGELVVDHVVPPEGMAPTEFMEQSVRHVAQRRRRARRRPYEIAAVIGVACTVIGLLIGSRLDQANAVLDSGDEVTASVGGVAEISSFALAMPVDDPISTETAMTLLAESRNLLLVRNDSPNGAIGDQDGRALRQELPPRRVRADLARRGFDYALVVPRDDVSEVVAAVGEMMGAGGLDSAPRLLPSDSADPMQVVSQDAWNVWSQQPNIARSMASDAPFIVVPIAVFPSD